ncbi:MAG TPA: rhodanese-like domain-containing protein [Burkholderiaceae bacterium]|nr:rhodanese-like domain-containing protein [Burkholderiaceae bacterium]
MNSSLRLGALALALSLCTPIAGAQNAPAAPASAPAWKYKTRHLGNAEIDALLATPAKLLVLDLRRPDELIKYGSFPVFLSVQAKELESHLAYLPKDRTILTVSNHAGRAGAAGDLLSARGFKVAGAAGSEDYEKAGGLAVVHIQPPAAAVAAASAPR